LAIFAKHVVNGSEGGKNPATVDLMTHPACWRKRRGLQKIEILFAKIETLFLRQETTRMKNPLRQVIQGYLLSIGARHLSPHTISDYKNTFNKFMLFVETDVPFSSITRQNVEAFLASFKIREPGGKRDKAAITKKTLLHYHIALSALWTWAISEEITSTHVIHNVRAPKPEQREIIPFTETEFKLLLSANSRSKTYTRPGKRKCDNELPNPERSRAILLLMLDTGFRANELCTITLKQVDQRNNRIQVFGKGALERSVPFSPRTAQALWRYLTARPEAEPDEPLFITSQRRAMDRGQLAKFLTFLAKRAGVSDVHPHRFRHTFAIQYLRNGGDPYTLQKLLGHSTLDMVKKYLALAQIDIEKAHKHASPVDNWSL
jgi:site-specific recombinase XerD